MISVDLSEVFPWSRFLPPEDAEEFKSEFVQAFREAAEFGAPLGPLIASWRATAEVYADPEALAALRSPTWGDFGPVMPPTASPFKED